MAADKSTRPLTALAVSRMKVGDELADTVGPATVVDRLQAYGDRMGAGFSISPLLLKLAVEGRFFTR